MVDWICVLCAHDPLDIRISRMRREGFDQHLGVWLARSEVEGASGCSGKSTTRHHLYLSINIYKYNLREHLSDRFKSFFFGL